MGKRSEFERKPRDLYRTWDRRAIAALLPHLHPRTRFIEPCAGAGDLVRQLEEAGHECVGASDIVPLAEGIDQADALTLKMDAEYYGSVIWVTNPPWSRPILHALVSHLADQAPLWILIDADWVHTKQAIPFLPRIKKIVSIGRLRWEENTTMDGKDNCVWILLEQASTWMVSPAQFYGRTPTKVAR